MTREPSQATRPTDRILGREAGGGTSASSDTGLLACLARLLACELATFALLAIWVIGAALVRGARRERLRVWTMRRWGRISLWAFRVRVTVDGSPPTSAGLVVSNHVSYIDILLYASVLGASFVSMVEVRSWPVLGLLARVAGTVFIDRAKRRELVVVNGRIEHVLGAGRQLVLFPEGSNSDGSQVQPFRPSLLQPAARGALPVHYAAVTYCTSPGDPPASSHVAWFDGAPFLPHAWRLMRGRPVEAKVRFGPVAIRSRDRKQLAEDLRGAVQGLFEPLA